MSRFRSAWVWLKWPLALGLLGWLIWLNKDGLSELRHRQVQWPFLFAAAFCCGSAALITFARWYLLVRAQEFPFHLRDAVRLGFVGQLLSYVGPGVVGGDLFKAIILAREQKSRRSAAVATVLLDRVLGLLSLFILGALSTLLNWGLPVSAETQIVTRLLWTGSIVGILGVTIVLIPGSTRWWLVRQIPRLPLVGKTCGELIEGVVLYQARPLVVIGAVLMGLVSHAALITGFYCGGRAIEPWVLDLSRHFYFMPMAELFATVLPTPGGIGGLEGAVVYSYQSLAGGAVTDQEARQAGLIAALVFRLVQMSIAGVGMIYYFASRQEISSALVEAADSEGTSATVPHGLSCLNSPCS